MSAFKVQRSAVAKTAAGSYGSIAAADARRKQSAGLAPWRTAAPGCRGVLAVPAINRHRRRAAPWPSTSTSGSGSGSDANGDAVPRQLSGLLKHHLRPDDVLGRFGG